MKKTIVIISFFTLSILSLFSCSKAKDTSKAQFSGIKFQVDGKEYAWSQSQYNFIIQKQVNGGVVSFWLITQNPTSPKVNDINFQITTATSLTPGVYTYRQPWDILFWININRTTSEGYFFTPKTTMFGGKATSDFSMTLATKSSGLGTGDFSVTCYDVYQSGTVNTSKEYSVQGNFYNIPILE